MPSRSMLAFFAPAVTANVCVTGKRRALVPPEVGYVSRDLQPMPEEVSCVAAHCVASVQTARTVL